MNRGSGCCRPTPYRLAIAPIFAFVNTQLLFTKTKISLPPLLQELGIAYSGVVQNIPIFPKIKKYKLLERITRLELATSTLARWRSTR